MRDAKAAKMREAKCLKALNPQEQPETELPEVEEPEEVSSNCSATTSVVFPEQPEEPTNLGEREVISQDFDEDPESG